MTPGCENVDGIGRMRQRDDGQTIMKARPMTSLSGIVPRPGSSWCSRESAEIARLSPSTHRRPGGTVMLK